MPTTTARKFQVKYAENFFRTLFSTCVFTKMIAAALAVGLLFLAESGGSYTEAKAENHYLDPPEPTRRCTSISAYLSHNQVTGEPYLPADHNVSDSARTPPPPPS